MTDSLQFRLFAAFVLVIIVSVGTVALFVMGTAQHEIDEYEDLTRRLELTRMEHWLLGYYAATDGWEGLESYIAEMSILYGHTIVVTDAAGRVVADSRGEMHEEGATTELPGREVPLDRSSDTVGILYISDEPTVATAYTEALADSMNLFLLWGSLLATAVALILTLLLSHRISAPIRRLADFARLAGGGDLSARVPVTEKGEIGALAAAMNTMVADLERAGELRRNMVADTAHELRTPLSNIIGYLEAYDDRMADRDLVVSMISEEAAVLARLVEDLHELAAADAGTFRLAAEPASPSNLVDRVTASARPAAARKGVTLVTDLAPGLPPTITIDPQRVAQVLQNLIRNALTFTGAGDTITVSARGAAEGFIEVTVADTGEGIASEDLENVFERYYRADRSRSRATGGSGLGLSIAKQIVVAHGGRIHAETRPGGGTRIVILLPTVPPSLTPQKGDEAANPS